MKKEVVISITGKQSYMDQDPEVIQLVTDGILEQTASGWDLTYEESDLTGLEGVTTAFRVEPDVITLDRTGKLTSQMVFQEGKYHDSLYQMSFGALMITVCASKVRWDLSEKGGTLDLVYAIEIEKNAAGIIEYHLDIQPKEAV